MLNLMTVFGKKKKLPAMITNSTDFDPSAFLTFRLKNH
jgi:hypothetical protein